MARPKDGLVPAGYELKWPIRPKPTVGSKMLVKNSESWSEVELTIQVLRAKNLEAGDKSGFSDPFCTITVGKHTKSKWKTTIKHQTLEPEWMENAHFNVMPKMVPIKLKVKDDDGGVGRLRIGADLLGEVTFQLDCTPANKALADGKVMHKWIKLEKGATGKDQQVELKIKICPTKGYGFWDPIFGRVSTHANQ
jgi:hypothetical protein